MSAGKIRTILLIDDDPIYRKLSVRIIEKTELVDNVVTFSNGEEALHYLEYTKDKPEELPDIILLDLWMPVMDGWEFLEELEKIQPNFSKEVQIYISTSSINPKDHEKARSIDMVADYLVKPLTQKKIERLVQQTTG